MTALQANPEALAGLIAIGLERVLGERIDELSPAAQQTIRAGIPALAAAGAREVSSGLFPNIMASTTASSASNLATMGSGLIAVAIQVLGQVIQAQGARGAESLNDTVFGLKNMDSTMIPFTVWVWDTLFLSWIFQAATDNMEAEGAGDVPGDGTVPGDGETPIGDFDAEDDLIGPLVDRAEADGIEVSRPGDDTLVIAGASAGGLLLVGLAFGIFGK